MVVEADAIDGAGTVAAGDAVARRRPRKGVALAAAGLVLVVLLAVGAVLGVDAWVRTSTEDRVLTVEQAAGVPGVDCIIVLGCGVNPDGSPSDMLADRIARGVELYEQGAAPKLLMSGDHGKVDYNEVGKMKEVAVAAGVPSEDVFMDHAGFSTYETMARARDVFGARRVVVVTQGYHLPRALYLAEALGLEAYGVSADLRPYAGQEARDIREVLARVKDFFSAIAQPEPTFLGDPISLTGSGDVTND